MNSNNSVLKACMLKNEVAQNLYAFEISCSASNEIHEEMDVEPI